MSQYEGVTNSIEQRRLHAAKVVESLTSVLSRIEAQKEEGKASLDPGNPASLELLSTSEGYWASGGRHVTDGRVNDVAALETLIPLAIDYRDSLARWNKEGIAEGLRKRRRIEPTPDAEWLVEEPDISIQNEDVRWYWATVRYLSKRSWIQSNWQSVAGQYESLCPAFERFRTSLVPDVSTF
ncbi:MAG: hypothetical protein ACRDNH_06980 [Gaiellaceae bacterium]